MSRVLRFDNPAGVPGKYCAMVWGLGFRRLRD